MTKTFDAYIGPSGEKRSLRQGELSQDARDLLALCFEIRIPANEVVPLPMTAAEVEIEGDLDNILHGGGGFVRHGGSDSWEYFKHKDDELWAVVFANDCDGDPERGAELIERLNGEEEDA